MVKEIPDHTTDSVRVVYNCGDDWNNFKNYTSALTNLRDLKLGWKHEEICDHYFIPDISKYAPQGRMICQDCGEVKE